MKFISGLVALYWLGMVASLFFGYQPSVPVIGIGFLLASLCFVKDLF